MYYYIDESGNTGLNLFDATQPILYYGVLESKNDLDVIASPFLIKIREGLNVTRLHAKELGVGRLLKIAQEITEFSTTHNIKFSAFKVNKQDHAIITFFDQVFDSGMNKSVNHEHYFTPLRYHLLIEISKLFDENLKKEAWNARKEFRKEKCDDTLRKLCASLYSRAQQLTDLEFKHIISKALLWASENPSEINFGVDRSKTALQISPNLVGFQLVLHAIAIQSSASTTPVQRIVVDQQTEFNSAQSELAGWYRQLRGTTLESGPGMPSLDFSKIPEAPPRFMSSEESSGLELVDITLWIYKRLEENKETPQQLIDLFWSQANDGITNEVSLDAIKERWIY